ncbi:Trs33p NDAI_0B04310 [Naumovozyma dairenensis CBS 421]|uniref:Trafficking protein particle complex subunit n=1 Tax=Naumovozyma dairenensis (strain ATCC 10597 / BCRC 20456 / CBS 421 / NBRC 0211 / NRRL Y-12639) TaxID=1071378 RepID=G0W6Q4_NAUDC|nr:hypothetical protein NDAI_0B04310 [Naumovozyma dairenensis CBS 421]CCD23465.1 hypothetical protein NDAI_0B04310 [Naumovozyma dairenensis CBS 421]
MDPTQVQRQGTDQERIQHQFQLFQESLPKVSHHVYEMLLNEIIPMTVSVENQLEMIASEDTSKGDLKEVPIEKLALEDKEIKEEKSDRISTNYNTNGPLYQSHKMLWELSEMEDEEKCNNISERLRNIGFQLGKKLSELLVFTNNPNLKFKGMDLLMVMKFICRDVWKQIFGKQIDNLKTNHRGTFYLIDYEYRPIQSFSLSETASKMELKLAEPFFELPLGIIKGVLASLGYFPDDVICLASFIDRPPDRAKNAFSKGVSFHIQVNLKPQKI